MLICIALAVLKGACTVTLVLVYTIARHVYINRIPSSKKVGTFFKTDVVWWFYGGHDSVPAPFNWVTITLTHSGSEYKSPNQLLFD